LKWREAIPKSRKTPDVSNAMSCFETLGDRDWLASHEGAIKNALPETWTHVENIDGLRLGFALKLLGIDWKTEQEFGKVMLFLEHVGILERKNGYQVRANPIRIFSCQLTSSTERK